MTENLTIRDVERELARLRHASAEEDHHPRMRTSVMTHMAWVPERWEEAALDTLSGLGERHPSRTIVLLPKPDESRDALDGDVDLRCFMRGGEEREVCSEVIVLRLCGQRALAPASVVEPLLVADLPAFLRWRGPLPFGAPELEQLVGVADRLVVDSTESPRPGALYQGLPTLFELIAVSDIAWARLQPWREGLAGLWPGIADAERIRVAGPEAEALLLSHWLGARFGRQIELDHEPAGEVELVEVAGKTARPARFERRSASDLLSDQLEIFGRDRVYEEAVWSFSSART